MPLALRVAQWALAIALAALFVWGFPGASEESTPPAPSEPAASPAVERAAAPEPPEPAEDAPAAVNAAQAEPAPIYADWPEAQRTSFLELEAAFAHYTAVEPCAGAGQASAAEQLAPIAAVQRFDAGRLPSHSAQAARNAETELNRVYQRLQTSDRLGKAFTFEGLRAAKSAFLAYRSAWLAFATLRYPKAPSQAFEAWLALAQAERLRACLI